MRDPHNQSFKGAPYLMLFVSACCAVLVLLLSSCSANLPVQREAQQAKESVLAVRYSIICIIHGDGDYLYHDTNGHEYKADEEALAGAKRVAQQNPQAEVFIFRQMPKKHFLFFFPLHDGDFYYYRNGKLIANELYWRDETQARFDPEVSLFRRFRANNQVETMSFFIYCGHEIPEVNGVGYDASFPDRAFTVHDLADGLKKFTRDSARFELMLLSTCFGGTPYTISTLGMFARYIIASPGNLHLSYFDLQPLERLEIILRDRDVPAFAKGFARQAFDRLTMNVQTAVSVAVYDVDTVQEYIHSVYKIYNDTLTTLKGETRASMGKIEHCDCADLPAYVLPTMNNGVDIFYRPARFGSSKYKKTHSGWECWRERIPKSATSQTVESSLK